MISDICEVKWNEKYKRYVTAYGRIFRINKSGKCVECKLRDLNGYRKVGSGILAHRIVYETFNSDIPEDLQIDHINDIRDDNYIKNLRLVTLKENSSKSSRCKRISEARKGKKLSEEHKRKLSDAKKCRHWYLSSDGKRHWQ